MLGIDWTCWLAGLIVGIMIGYFLCQYLHTGPGGGENPQPAPAGMVWDDANGNCARDPGEVGIPDIRVELRDMANVLISWAVTDGNGNYAFPNASVLPGNYTVVIPTLPAGKSFVCDSNDSPGAIPIDPNRVPVTVPASGPGPMANFGYH